MCDLTPQPHRKPLPGSPLAIAAGLTAIHNTNPQDVGCHRHGLKGGCAEQQTGQRRRDPDGETLQTMVGHVAHDQNLGDEGTAGLTADS